MSTNTLFIAGSAPAAHCPSHGCGHCSSGDGPHQGWLVEFDLFLLLFWSSEIGAAKIVLDGTESHVCNFDQIDFVE